MKHLIIILFLSCIGCTVEKRLHRPGFTIRKNNSQISSNKTTSSKKRKSARHHKLTIKSKEKQSSHQTTSKAKIKVDKKPLKAKSESKEKIVTTVINSDEKTVQNKHSDNTLQSEKEPKENKKSNKEVDPKVKAANILTIIAFIASIIFLASIILWIFYEAFIYGLIALPIILLTIPISLILIASTDASKYRTGILIASIALTVIAPIAYLITVIGLLI